ncbi:hypothetical protein BGZ46_010528 [Entomortierella lignicola]|nr:hypothetical protein BGZ46_010528 [Entomortierella lignicola]
MIDHLGPNFAYMKYLSWYCNEVLTSRGLPTSLEITQRNLNMAFTFLFTIEKMELHLNFHPLVPFFRGLPLKKLVLNMANCPAPEFDVSKFSDIFSSVSRLALTLHSDNAGLSVEHLADEGP